MTRRTRYLKELERIVCDCDRDYTSGVVGNSHIFHFDLSDEDIDMKDSAWINFIYDQAQHARKRLIIDINGIHVTVRIGDLDD